MILDTLVIPIIVTLSPVLIGGIGYMIKNVFTRLHNLEKSSAVTEQQVRQLLADKVDPVKEDISEIRKTLDYIFQYFLTPKK